MITVRGATTARAAAEKLTTYAGAVGDQAEALAGERAQQIGEEARRYEPPPLPSYRRTGRLARSWRLTVQLVAPEDLVTPLMAELDQIVADYRAPVAS